MGFDRLVGSGICVGRGGNDVGRLRIGEAGPEYFAVEIAGRGRKGAALRGVVHHQDVAVGKLGLLPGIGAARQRGSQVDRTCQPRK